MYWQYLTGVRLSSVTYKLHINVSKPQIPSKVDITGVILFYQSHAKDEAFNALTKCLKYQRSIRFSFTFPDKKFKRKVD